jgi:N-alpha-acetyltransferase 15/16, NatA auxiliary subunit
LLYHVRILEEMGEASEALAILDAGAKSRSIVDRTAIMTFRGTCSLALLLKNIYIEVLVIARLLSQLQSEEAEHTWRALIEQNPECYDYYRGFMSNQGINLGIYQLKPSFLLLILIVLPDSVTDDKTSQALAILHDFSSQIPRAAAPRRLSLNIATGDQFKDLARPYLLSGLKKGIPSLFFDVKGLYGDGKKRQVVEDIVEQVRESLSPAGTLSSEDNRQHSSSSDFPSDEPPTTYLWTLYFLAQHYSSLRKPTRALSLLDLALNHTPTLPELYTCKARVLKRAGDYFGATRCLDEARLLDGQDRFLNTKSAKYRLRAGLIQEANEILGLFTKVRIRLGGSDLQLTKAASRRTQ